MNFFGIIVFLSMFMTEFVGLIQQTTKMTMQILCRVVVGVKY